MASACVVKARNGRTVLMETVPPSALDGVPYQIFPESDDYLVAVNEEMFAFLASGLQPWLDPHGIAALIEAWLIATVNTYIDSEEFLDKEQWDGLS